ncbi:MAG: VOC family protein [Planctomycetota bacterium]|nr:VOC family protein [Planctomycetota bacterium]MDA1161850.1 VOC family protein [Planctomycetota bacterium]
MSNQFPIRENAHSITAYMIVPCCVEALAFYEKAFGAQSKFRLDGPGGSTMHAEMRIGDSNVMMTDENLKLGMKSPATLGGGTMSLHIHVADVDAAQQQAVEAGCEVLMPAADMFWGARFCQLQDPFGHQWSIAQDIETVSPEELMIRHARVLKQMEQSSSGEK